MVSLNNLHPFHNYFPKGKKPYLVDVDAQALYANITRGKGAITIAGKGCQSRVIKGNPHLDLGYNSMDYRTSNVKKAITHSGHWTSIKIRATTLIWLCLVAA